MISIQQYVIDYSEYFKTLSNRQVNQILEDLMDHQTLDLQKSSVQWVRKIPQNKKTVLFNLNSLKIPNSTKKFLFDLAKLQDISHLLILNTLLLNWFNNNQLRSLSLPFKITNQTFEMYSSVINSITFDISKPDHKSYCSMFPDVGSIGIDTDLYDYLLKNKIQNPIIIVNPPFTEAMIKRAIKNVKKIQTLKTKSMMIYFTVPVWQPQDYQKGGIYYPLYQLGFTSEVKDYKYINPLTKKIFIIKSSVFIYKK